MANKGLKEENSMLEFNLSDISVSIDLTKQNRNVVVTIPELLMSNQMCLIAMRDTFRSCYDVYMENSEDWWKVWRHKK